MLLFMQTEDPTSSIHFHSFSSDVSLAFLRALGFTLRALSFALRACAMIQALAVF